MTLTTDEQAEQSNIHGNVGKTSNADYLIEYKAIPNTPFTIVTTENGVMGVMGNNQITERRETVEEVEAELKEITWDRIMQVIMILTNKI